MLQMSMRQEMYCTQRPWRWLKSSNGPRKTRAVCRTIWIAFCDDLAAATKDFSDCWAAHEATSAKLCNAFREVCNRRATHEAICFEAKRRCKEHMKSNARPRKYKKACRHTGKEKGEFPTSTPERKVTSMTESSRTNGGQSHPLLDVWRPGS